MSLNRFFFFCAVLISAAFIQHSKVALFGVKPLWVLAVLIPIVLAHDDFFANMGLVLMGAILLKSQYAVEKEILFFIGFFIVLLLVQKYVFKQEAILLFGAIVLASAGFAAISFYPPWYEVLYNFLLASGAFVMIKKMRYATF